jgi:DNA replication protein DnaC
LSANPNISTQTIAILRDGTFIDRSEPVVFLGNSGTGKSHLLIAACLAAAEAGRRVRYTTCAQLANELCEAKDDNHLSRVVARYGKLDLLAIDELGYVHNHDLNAHLACRIVESVRT